MANNLLDQLGQSEVPPAPVEIRRDVHDRLNQWLLVAQIAELVVYGFGYAVMQFASAVLGLTNFTLSGAYHLLRNSASKEENNDTNDH